MTVRIRAALAVVMLLAACAAPAATQTAEPATPSAAPTAGSPEPTASGSPPASPSPSVEASSLRWERLEAVGPKAREDHTWTVTGDGRTALLFGGRDGATTFDDLWSYDLEADVWEELAVEGGPPARFGHESTWVDGMGLVVFAGQAGTTFFNDLWAFDPDAGHWTQLPAAGDVPVARYGSCAALGPDGRLWISHGFTADQVRFADTRAYDFEAGAWSDETPSGSKPVERCLHGCWWTDDGELALYAGQTTGTPALGDRWTLAPGGSWSSIEGSLPAPRNLYARARLDGATLVFGGQALDASFLADLWLLSDGDADAVAVEPAGPGPEGRSGAELVRDAERGRVLLFGGRGASGALGDAWALSGTLAAP